jgi:hypothetical protein
VIKGIKRDISDSLQIGMSFGIPGLSCLDSAWGKPQPIEVRSYPFLSF